MLKSLLVSIPGGTVEGVRLPAQDLTSEAFRGLPLRPRDFASRAALLRALRGQAVEAGGDTGRLVDAAAVPPAAAGACPEPSFMRLPSRPGFISVGLARIRWGGNAGRAPPTVAARTLPRPAAPRSAPRRSNSRTAPC